MGLCLRILFQISEKKQGLNELASFDRSCLLRQVFHDINSIF